MLIPVILSGGAGAHLWPVSRGTHRKPYRKTGGAVLTAVVSRVGRDQGWGHAFMLHDDFLEIYGDNPLSVCERCDRQDLYEPARAGFISEFTGNSTPYEVPLNPELTLKTSKCCDSGVLRPSHGTAAGSWGVIVDDDRR
jgi:adenylylsulfate kinase-like enzyme